MSNQNFYEQFRNHPSKKQNFTNFNVHISENIIENECSSSENSQLFELKRMSNRKERPTIKKSMEIDDRRGHRDISNDRHNNARTPKKLAIKHNFPIDFTEDTFRE